MKNYCIRKCITLMFLSSSRDEFTPVAKFSDRCFYWFSAAILVPVQMGTNLASPYIALYI